jgi:hypothetical protein
MTNPGINDFVKAKIFSIDEELEFNICSAS